MWTRVHNSSIKGENSSRFQLLCPNIYGLQGGSIVDNAAERYIKAVTVIVFDIETTGFSRIYDRVIEIAMQDLSGGENSTFETLVNPLKRELNTSILNISDDMVTSPTVPRYH